MSTLPVIGAPTCSTSRCHRLSRNSDMSTGTGSRPQAWRSSGIPNAAAGNTCVPAVGEIALSPSARVGFTHPDRVRNEALDHRSDCRERAQAGNARPCARRARTAQYRGGRKARVISTRRRLTTGRPRNSCNSPWAARLVRNPKPRARSTPRGAMSPSPFADRPRLAHLGELAVPEPLSVRLLLGVRARGAETAR